MSPKPLRPSAKPAARPKSAPTTVIELVLGFLHDDEWPHETSEDGSAVVTGYSGDNGQYDIAIETGSDSGLVAIHVDLPVAVKTSADDAEALDDAAFSEVVALVCRLNSGLGLGNFDIDFDDGSVRFRVGVLLTDCTLQPQLFRNHLYAAAQAADQFCPLFAKVASGELEHMDALATLSSED